MMTSTTLSSLIVIALAVTVSANDTPHSVYHNNNEFYRKLANLEVVANMTTRAHTTLPTVGTQFACTGEPSAEAPTSVHALRPGDIKVVAGVGDSITAGFGAKSASIITIFTEYRGVAWSMGGDDTIESVTTVPNFLKKFNPDVQGWSIKTGGATSTNARNNLAVSGAIARDVPGQLDRLISKLQSDPNIDYENDWKMMTIWIGGNDLCDVCNNKPENQPEQYIAYVRQSLDYLHDVVKVPRLFVNMVQILDVSRLNEVSGIVCSIVHFVACSCATTAGAGAREKVRVAALEYQRLTAELVDSGRYDTRDDFTVVLQPFFIDTQVPQKPGGGADTTYFAPDCFHFSQKGQAAAALGLWNNMMQPEAEKAKSWTLGEEPLCPTEERPYIFTRQNSQVAVSSGHGMQAEAVGDEGKRSHHHHLKTKVLAISGACIGAVTIALIAIVAVQKSRKRTTAPEKTPLVA